jgi:hypothetical protein
MLLWRMKKTLNAYTKYPAYYTERESQPSTSVVFPQGVIQRRLLSDARSRSDVISPPMSSPARSSLRVGRSRKSRAARILCSRGFESCSWHRYWGTFLCFPLKVDCVESYSVSGKIHCLVNVSDNSFVWAVREVLCSKILANAPCNTRTFLGFGPLQRSDCRLCYRTLGECSPAFAFFSWYLVMVESSLCTVGTGAKR